VTLMPAATATFSTCPSESLVGSPKSQKHRGSNITGYLLQMFLTRVFLLLVSLEIELFDSCETPVHFKQALKLLSISYVCR
jgi:hypothetical protein